MELSSLSPNKGKNVNFQEEKSVVREFYAALDSATPKRLGEVMAQFCAADLHWQGFHPFNEIRGAKAVAEQFWLPLRQALTSMQRRMDVSCPMTRPARNPVPLPKSRRIWPRTAG